MYDAPRSKWLLLAGCGWAFCAHASAFTPELNSVTPAGGTRGTELTLELNGNRLENPEQLLLYKPGVEVLGLEAKAPNQVIARLRIALEAPLGEHAFRLRTKGGLTYLRTFSVSPFSSLSEAEPNSEFDKAQRVEPNTTVEGVITSEDVDYYVCRMKKGERLSVEAEAMRLGRAMFDSSLAILDEKKFELKVSDDTALLRTDPCGAVIIPEDGEYRIAIREAAYEGSEQSRYRLHIGTFPRSLAVFPPAAVPGSTTTFTFLGDPAGPWTQEVAIPADAGEQYAIFPQQNGISAPSPHMVGISTLASVNETEPNNKREEATALPPLPCAGNGILDKPDESDWFRFEAKKDDALVLKTVARSLRSPVDTVLTLFDNEGKRINSNDDQGGPDSLLNWTSPADGTYFLRVQDQLKRSGPDFVYRVEITRKEASVAGAMPAVDVNDPQKQRALPLPRGNRFAAVVNLTRENISADLQVTAAALPQGVILHAPVVPKAATSIPIVLEAAADAPIAGGLFPFSIRTTAEPVIQGPLRESFGLIYVNNQGSYHTWDDNRLSVAVTEEAPFDLDFTSPATPLVPKGTLPVNVHVNRKPGYDEAISVKLAWTPPGLGTPNAVTIEKGKSEGVIELNANPDTGAATWPLVLVAEANTPQGPLQTASPVREVKVEAARLDLKFELAATEQGKSIPMLATVEVAQPFEGMASAELLGLPHGVTCPKVEFKADQTQITFPLNVSADAAVGKHGSVFAKVLVPHPGGMIVHQAGQGATLRIDKPSGPPAQTAAAAPQPTPQGDTPAPAKPLSRLEQLRQQRATP